MSSFVQSFKSWNHVFAGLVCPFAGCLLSFPASIFLHIVFFRTMWPNNFISLSGILFVNIKTDPILSNTHLFVLLSTHDTLNSLRSLSLSPKLIPATVLLCSPLRGPMTPAVVYWLPRAESIHGKVAFISWQKGRRINSSFRRGQFAENRWKVSIVTLVRVVIKTWQLWAVSIPLTELTDTGIFFPCI